MHTRENKRIFLFNLNLNYLCNKICDMHMFKIFQFCIKYKVYTTQNLYNPLFLNFKHIKSYKILSLIEIHRPCKRILHRELIIDVGY